MQLPCRNLLARRLPSRFQRKQLVFDRDLQRAGVLIEMKGGLQFDRICGQQPWSRPGDLKASHLATQRGEPVSRRQIGI